MGKKFKGGYIGQLDESQEKALAEMHERFAEWKPKVASWESAFQLDDRFFLKFLRARDFDVEKAAAMLTKTLEFREKWKPHTLTLSTPAVKEAMSKGSWRLNGHDKDGHPIQLIDLANFNPKEVKNMDEFVQGILFHREMSLKQLAVDGWKTETTTVIFDLGAWSFLTHGGPAGLGCTRTLIEITQNHFPETLEKAIIFNAPFVFRTAWAIIRPWLDPDTAARVIFVTDPSKLHDIIDPEVLEVRYGGTRKEPHPAILDFFPK